MKLDVGQRADWSLFRPPQRLTENTIVQDKVKRGASLGSPINQKDMPLKIQLSYKKLIYIKMILKTGKSDFFFCSTLTF